MDTPQNIDALFAKAKLTPTAIPFSESKDLFIQCVEAGAPAPKGKLHFINLKNILIMIGIVGTLSLLVTFSISSNSTTEVVRGKTETQETISTSKVAVEKPELRSEPETSKSTKKERHWVDLIQPLPLREIYLKRELALQSFSPVHPPLSEPSQNTDDSIYFPKLTEKEIAANHRQKSKMIKALSKFNKKQYSYIPSGSFSYQGTETSVQAFYMSSKEVTNLEYRTFLFDLLIQGRKDAFIAAAPDQTLWTTVLDDSLKSYQNDYFSDSALDYFPVVNVSKKGAEMYCVWLTKETNKTIKSDFINDVRIPSIIEWTYAASSLGKHTVYPWQGKQLTTDGAFNANFKMSEYTGDLDLVKQKVVPRSIARTSFEYSVGLMVAWSKSYEPTQFGLYNMSGNVAEMVSMRYLPDFIEVEQPTENQLVTCGGSWMSPIEDLKIFNENITDQVNGHPSIGFRVVITHFNPVN